MLLMTMSFILGGFSSYSVFAQTPVEQTPETAIDPSQIPQEYEEFVTPETVKRMSMVELISSIEQKEELVQLFQYRVQNAVLIQDNNESYYVIPDGLRLATFITGTVSFLGATLSAYKIATNTLPEAGILRPFRTTQYWKELINPATEITQTWARRLKYGLVALGLSAVAYKIFDYVVEKQALRVSPEEKERIEKILSRLQNQLATLKVELQRR